jgi:hypothetical protein
MWSVAYVPFLMFFAIEYFRRVNESGAVRLRYALAFAAGFAALALTSFYMAWFTAVFSVFAAVLTLLMFCRMRGTANTLAGIRDWLRTNAKHVGMVAVAFAVLMTPFALLYLPKSGQVERNNLWALPVLLHPIKLPYMGMAHLWVALAVGVASIVWFRSVKSLKNLDVNWMIALCIAPALFVSLLFLLPVGEYTAWAGLYLFFPGGKYIRGPLRYYTFLTLPMMMLGSIGISKLMAKAASRKGDIGEFATVGTVALLCLMIFEQYKPGVPLVFGKQADQEWLARIPKPPAECKSFAVSPGSESQWFEKQLNGMVVAQRFDIPTLNGYSGTEPPGWTMMYPAQTGYMDGVRQWARNNYLSGVCVLDDKNASWSPLTGDKP